MRLVAELPLVDGVSRAKIYVGDYDRCLEYSWHRSGSGNKVYVYAVINGRQTALHRFIRRARPGSRVDHRNRNTFDCCRWNLRECSVSQNNRNRRKMGNSRNRFKGVFKNAGRTWSTYIRDCSGSKFYGGCFAKEEHAAVAYNILARLFHGEFACLNDIDEGPYQDAVLGRVKLPRK